MRIREIVNYSGMFDTPQIRDVENLNHLTELRVLNLAGNQIEQVDNLAGLSSIKEINLRRNRISTLVRFVVLP